MSNTTVRQVITDSINAHGLGEYLGQAEAVIADVEAAAENLVANLTEVAVDQGLTEAQAEGILIKVGLVQQPAPEPAATVTEATDDSIHGILNRLTASVERLEAAARRHGVSV